jgi:hypothetical protein
LCRPAETDDGAVAQKRPVDAVLTPIAPSLS